MMPLLSGCHGFHIRNLLSSKLVFPCRCRFFLTDFMIFSFSLDFRSFCLGMISLSWVFSFLNTQVCVFHQVSVIIFEYIFSTIFKFFPSGTQMIWILDHFILSLNLLRPIKLCSCFFDIFSLLLELG